MVNRTRAPGELEAAIMDVLWRAAAPLAARDIVDHLPGQAPALTTALTSLDRLHKKGQVLRTEVDRGVRFQAVRSAEEHASQKMLEVLSQTHDRSATLLWFSGELTAEDVALLQQAIAARTNRDR